MNMQEKSDLQKFVIAKVVEVLDREVEIEEDTDLKREGIDSLTTVDLIFALEEEFDLQIDDGDLTVDNFGSVQAICSLLIDKYGVLST